jgi:hypothetical protein
MWQSLTYVQDYEKRDKNRNWNAACPAFAVDGTDWTDVHGFILLCLMPNKEQKDERSVATKMP